MTRKYSYRMGIMIGDTALPDPSSWKYQVGDLDTSGRRDAKGKLHRHRVATKINYEFSWNSIEWEMLQTILEASSKAKFTLKAPDPRTFSGRYSGKYYVGDRTGSAKYFFANSEEQDDGPHAVISGGKYSDDGTHKDIAQYDLKLKFIEF